MFDVKIFTYNRPSVTEFEDQNWHLLIDWFSFAFWHTKNKEMILTFAAVLITGLHAWMTLTMTN